MSTLSTPTVTTTGDQIFALTQEVKKLTKALADSQSELADTKHRADHAEQDLVAAQALNKQLEHKIGELEGQLAIQRGEQALKNVLTQSITSPITFGPSRECPGCYALNNPNNQACYVCGKALD